MEILNCIDFCKIYITFFLDNKTTFLFAKTKVHPQEAINNKKPQQMSGVWSERKDKNDYTNTTKKKCTSPCPFLAKYSISSTSTSFTMLQGTGGPTLPAVLKKKKKNHFIRSSAQASMGSIDWLNKQTWAYFETRKKWERDGIPSPYKKEEIKRCKQHVW